VSDGVGGGDAWVVRRAVWVGGIGGRWVTTSGRLGTWVGRGSTHE
jgi:hypothetical protein